MYVCIWNILMEFFYGNIYKRKFIEMFKILSLLALILVIQAISARSQNLHISPSKQQRIISIKFTDENNRQLDTETPALHSNSDTETIPIAPAFNPTPLLLQQSQAPRSYSYRNPITEDSVKSNAIFNRQINANKAIANLLEIVERLSANVAYAKNQIPKYQNQYKKSISVQRTVQNKIYIAEAQKSKLYAAINNLNDNISRLKKQLTELESSSQLGRQELSLKRNKILAINQALQKNQSTRKDQATQHYNKKQEIYRLEKQQADADQQVKKRLLQIQNNKKQASGIDSQLEVIEKNIKSTDQEITDLKRRLNAAENRKIFMENQQKRLKLIKLNAPTVQAQLQGELIKSTQKREQIQSRKTKLLSQSTQLTSSINEIAENINVNTAQINRLKAQIQPDFNNLNSMKLTMKTKNKQISDATVSLQYLKNQLGTFETNLRNIYFEGADANAKVQAQKENLDAFVKKWVKSSNQLTEATNNLQRARAQKQLADLAVQQILRQRSNVLPYAPITASNTLQKNNDQNAKPNQGSSTEYQKDSNKVKPLTLLPLYRKISAPQIRQGESQENLISFDGDGNFVYSGDFKCEGFAEEKFEGIIRFMGINILTLEAQDGRICNALIGSSSRMSANSSNYVPQVGDRISISGRADGVYFKIYQAFFNREGGY